MPKLARFILFAIMFASSIGAIIGVLQMLFTFAPLTQPFSTIVAYGLGVISMWVFLSIGSGRSRRAGG